MSRPRSDADGEPGMTIRLDPPRLRELQRIAREAGLRPGQLAQRWVEERLAGGDAQQPSPDRSVEPRASASTQALAARLDELAARVDELAARMSSQPASAPATGSNGQSRPTTAAESRRPRLHEEIVAVLRESGGFMSAGEIAQAIRDRGNYHAPRSNEQVNGAMVSGRVSNPHYRSQFVREGRRIGLAERPSET